MKARRLMLCVACYALLPRAGTSAQASNDTAAAEQRPVLLTIPQVACRPCLQDAGVRGQALVRLMLDTTGHVEDGSVVVEQSAGTILDSLAIAASRGLVFRPARESGSPVRMAVILPFDFGAGGPAVAAVERSVFSADCVDSEPVLKAVDPVTYPEMARKRGIAGEALAEFVVDTSGALNPAPSGCCMQRIPNLRWRRVGWSRLRASDPPVSGARSFAAGCDSQLCSSSPRADNVRRLRSGDLMNCPP